VPAEDHCTHAPGGAYHKQGQDEPELSPKVENNHILRAQQLDDQHKR
jgi:hypothetical protein